MYCYHCMRESRTAICEYCGFDISGYIPIPTALYPGTRLHEKYVLGAVLGKGGFGITYVGFDLSVNRKIAIKEYFPSILAVRDAAQTTELSVSLGQRSIYQVGVQKFFDEASVLARINHLTASVKVFDFFYENNTAYIVMEYIGGTTVEGLVKMRGPLAPELVLTIYYPVLQTLAEIHRMGILHRDISPCNIILDADYQARLIDFGAARAFSAEISSDLSVILKNGFAPIEQYTRKARHGPAEDIYALSASIYYSLTGKVPPVSTERLVFDNIKPFSAFGIVLLPELEQIIMKGLAVRREERWQSADEMLAAIDELFSNGQDISESQKESQELPNNNMQQTSKSKMRIYIGIAVIVAILLIILILFLGGL